MKILNYLLKILQEEGYRDGLLLGELFRLLRDDDGMCIIDDNGQNIIDLIPDYCISVCKELPDQFDAVWLGNYINNIFLPNLINMATYTNLEDFDSKAILQEYLTEVWNKYFMILNAK